MARRVIIDTQYTFTPATRTIVIPRIITRERFLLITNVTNNTVMYNFSDPTLGLTSHSTTTTASSASTGSTNGYTTIVLAYNTTSMSSTDKIQITVDEPAEVFTPDELYTDPVNKIRTSQPQALIDTDFEYSRQDTKWESIALINYQPFAYANNAAVLNVATISASANGSRTIIVTPNNSLVEGTPFYIYDTTFTGGGDGMFIVDSSNTTAFTYTARYPFPNNAIANIQGSGTTAFGGANYTSANLSFSTITLAGNVVTVNTISAHGLSVGNEIILRGITGTNPPNGTYYVTTVAAANSFQIMTPVTASGLTTTSAQLFVKPTGYVSHRAFDGGVRFSTYSQSHGQQLIRQTRRYFRYQSGKGIQISTGSILQPEITIDNLTSSGNTVTVVTKEPHNIYSGTSVVIGGAEQTAYNGTFSVATVTNPYTFTYNSATNPTSATATGDYRLNISNWNGAGARIGLFDDQNGIFFEYDGTTLYAVRRSATFQLSGQATVINGSTAVTGLSSGFNGSASRFSGQLVPGDSVVIRGSVYKVIDVLSDTSMTIYPAYRGPTVATPDRVIINKVIDTKIPQSTWNIDKCDGTGPSGFVVNLSKMQMFYMDYSWYGAGFIRWGFRGSDGNIIYCHKMINNNVNYEAYMRSGNLPARYETFTHAKYTELTSTLSSSEVDTISVANAQFWPNSGTVWVRNNTQSEFISYTGRSNTALTGLTRTNTGNTTITVATTAGSPTLTTSSTVGLQNGQYINGPNVPPGAYVVSFVGNTSILMSTAATTSNAAMSAQFAPLGQSTPQAFTYSATYPTQVQLHAPSFSPTISHWGTSVIMDGRYDDDKSFVFTNGMTSSLAVASGARNALMSFRISPSVSNGTPASRLGQRELVNRMQMVLRQLDLLSAGTFLITIVLNGRVSSATPVWQNVGGSSLAQYINHTSTTTIAGGEVIFGFFTNASGGASTFTTTSQDLPLVRDLGNSILGGGTTDPQTGFYPDGPDIVTVMAQNVGASSANVFARMSWTEAQA
jgi:hypothetical protein